MRVLAVGLIMGTRLWYAMWDAEKDDDSAFERRLDSVVREIGERGDASSRSGDSVSPAAESSTGTDWRPQQLRHLHQLRPAPAPRLYKHQHRRQQASGNSSTCVAAPTSGCNKVIGGDHAECPSVGTATVNDAAMSGDTRFTEAGGWYELDGGVSIHVTIVAGSPDGVCPDAQRQRERELTSELRTRQTAGAGQQNETQRRV